MATRMGSSIRARSRKRTLGGKGEAREKGHYRQWIPEYREKDAVMHSATLKTEPLIMEWTPEREKAFHDLKVTIEKSIPIVLDHPCTVIVPHAVLLLLNSAATQHFTTARRASYEVILLSRSNCTYRRSLAINPATFVPLPSAQQDGDDHDCLLAMKATTTPPPDLRSKPIDNTDLILFTDGSLHRPRDDLLLAGYAIVTPHEIVEAYVLTIGTSAQEAELYAITRACFNFGLRKSCQCLPDSRYVFGIAHDYGQLWKKRGFITLSGKAIKHTSFVLNLLEVIQLPQTLVIIKCEAHTSAKNEVSKGNRFADMVANQVALQQEPVLQTPRAESGGKECMDVQQLQEAQNLASQQEKCAWSKSACYQNTGLWRHPDGLVMCPHSFFCPWLAWHMARLTRGKEGCSMPSFNNGTPQG
ncbi:uncharacterized protein LOC134353752 [Mobula hypostoma]|uniref:uncharacterized protein LOC134353752 n=1 Tax=Mobula hypostoma TaxID=723540 RepID=UPI002FC3DFBE